VLVALVGAKPEHAPEVPAGFAFAERPDAFCLLLDLVSGGDAAGRACKVEVEHSPEPAVEEGDDHPGGKVGDGELVERLSTVGPVEVLLRHPGEGVLVLARPLVHAGERVGVAEARFDARVLPPVEGGVVEVGASARSAERVDLGASGASDLRQR